MDTFSNPAAGLGWGTGSINEGTRYVHTQLSQNYILMLSMYRSHWVCRKVIDTVPEDMLRKWITVMAAIDPSELRPFDKMVEDTQTVPQLLEALQWARLFGGSGALMVINGQKNLEKPLDLDSIQIGDYRGLLVFDRWSGIAGSQETINGLENPAEYGLPVFYTVTTTNGQQMRVHHSRILRFVGRKLPLWERQTVQGWGMSELELIYDPLRQFDNTNWGIAQLVHRANLLVKTVPGLDAAISTGNQAALTRMQNLIREQMAVLNNQGLWLLNGGDANEREELQAHQYSFGGLNDVQQNFQVIIAGAAEIPYTRLFQRTVSGLSQTNEGDEQIYYDMIPQKQNRELRPQLNKLLPVIAMSTWGQIPDAFDYTFRPLQEVNPKEKVELAKNRADAIIAVYEAQLITQKGALIELRAGQDDTGMFGTSITDEMIEDANDDLPEPMTGGELSMPPLNGLGEGNAVDPGPQAKEGEEDEEDGDKPGKPVLAA